MNSRIEWYKFCDPAKAKGLVEQEWSEHPLCDHLKPIENYLRARGAETWREEYITRPEVKIFVRAYLDVDSIRDKVQISPCVDNFEDPPGPHSWNLKGFACKIHRHLIAGDYEQLKGRPIIS